MVNLIEIEKLIITIREKRVIVDKDVATLYGVETKAINQLVKNNKDKFPKDYIFEINEKEKNELVISNDRLPNLKHATVRTKVFTEKGLYMLATLLRSKKAKEITFQIIETFSKLRELTRNISEISKIKKEESKKQLLNKSGILFNEIFEESLNLGGEETTIEINFAVLKFKHTMRKNSK